MEYYFSIFNRLLPMYTAISLATQDMYQPQMHIQTNYTCKVIKKKSRVEDKTCVASYCCSNCSSPRSRVKTPQNGSDYPRTCALLIL
jgi:hypothetical protein